jgi:hypothetical protein
VGILDLIRVGGLIGLIDSEISLFFKVHSLGINLFTLNINFVNTFGKSLNGIVDLTGQALDLVIAFTWSFEDLFLAGQYWINFGSCRVLLSWGWLADPWALNWLC